MDSGFEYFEEIGGRSEENSAAKQRVHLIRNGASVDFQGGVWWELTYWTAGNRYTSSCC